MTHHGGLSLSIVIWRIGGGGPSFLLPWGPKILLAALITTLMIANAISHQTTWTTPLTNYKKGKCLSMHFNVQLLTYLHL
jgi:hypothetical protein